MLAGAANKAFEFALLALLAVTYLGMPIGLLLGWVRWLKQPKQKTLASMFSTSGFFLATASALLAVISIAYAQGHSFGFYDPALLRIFRWGASLSLAASCLGLAGVWRRNSLRWFAPFCGLGSLAFWLFAAAGE